MPKENVEELKERIVRYFGYYATGYAHAKPRHIIVSALGIDDRLFRDVCTSIPEIMTSSDRGYWMLKEDVIGEEYRVAREALEEDRRRVISLWKRNKMKRRAIDELDNKNKQNRLF